MLQLLDFSQYRCVWAPLLSLLLNLQLNLTSADRAEMVNELRCMIPDSCQGHDSMLVYHVVIGVEHEQAAPLFTHHLCRAKQLCVAPTNMRFILHARHEDAQALRAIARIAKDYDMLPYIWIGEYSSAVMMEHRFRVLRDKADGNSFVVHADTDEFMAVEAIREGYRKIKRDECDYVVGDLVDRVAAGKSHPPPPQFHAA